MGKEDNLFLKSSGSLCFQISLPARECLIPSIIEAWFFSSDKIVQPGNRAPKVERVAQFEIYPDVNNSADSFLCKSANSFSSRT